MVARPIPKDLIEIAARVAAQIESDKVHPVTAIAAALRDERDRALSELITDSEAA